METLRVTSAFVEEMLMARSSLVTLGPRVMIVSQMDYIRLHLKYVMTKGTALPNPDRSNSQISPQY